MVLLETLSKKANQWLGPYLLKQGIKLRFALSGGVLRDSPTLDALTLLPLAQRLISLEVHDEIFRLRNNSLSWSLFEKKRPEEKDDDVDEEEEAKVRLHILERYLRPALVPDEQWSDVRRWQFNARLLKWARAEFLLAKYGRRVDKARRKLLQNNNDLLPSSLQITSALDMKDWALAKYNPNPNRDMMRISKPLGGTVLVLRGGGLSITHVPQPDTSLSDLELEEILEVAGGFVSSCGPLNALCEQSGIYQLWSKEYVECLGAYLRKRTEEHTGGETVVLDVGAGDGVLAQALRAYFETGPDVRPPKSHRKSRGFKATRQQQRDLIAAPRIVATDDQSWRIPTKAAVENLTAEQAMDTYAITANIEEDRQQVIVLCSWMPMGEDWSAVWRQLGNLGQSPLQ
jgi:hypothetical protein